MAKNFDRALPLFLKHEGGFVNHPKDPGGATNKGVTISNFRRYVKRGGSVDDLKRITNDQVATVYKLHYWDKVRGDELPSGVDYATADFAINSGPSRAAKYLQRVVGVKQDGKIGPVTMAAVDAMAPGAIITRICAERLAFMKRIRRGELWETFGRGWQRRVDDVERVAMQWASEKPKITPLPSVPASVVEDALRKDGSRTIKGADDAEKTVWQRITALLGSGGASALAYIQGIDWKVVAVIAAAGLIWYGLTELKSYRASKAIKAARVDDALSGKNTARRDALKAVL